MGVHGLWQLLKPSGRPVTLENLEGKILAIDISVWLHQASKGMRDRFGNPLPNAHLVVLFRRICKLLFYKIKPIFVFDGGIPTLKKQTMAYRREQKEVAAEESDRISDKILKNLLKQQLLKDAVTKKEKGNKKKTEVVPSVSSVLQTQPKQRDMFELEPLPEVKQNYLDEIEAETPWEEFSRYAVHTSGQDLTQIDIESEDFKSLPSEIQHELLVEMKESLKRTSWAQINKMPQEADDFSSFQMKRLLKKNSLASKLDSVRNEMNHQNSGKIAKEFGCTDSDSVLVRQMASEEDSHLIFVKGLQKSSAMKVLERHKDIKEESQDSKDVVKFEKSSMSESNQGMKESVVAATAVKVEENFEKDLLNEEIKNEHSVDAESSNRYNSAFTLNKNLLFSWAQSVESQAKTEATTPSKTDPKSQPLTLQKPSGKTINLSDEDNSEDSLLEFSLSQEFQPENLEQKYSKMVSERLKTPPKNEAKSKILDIGEQKLDSNMQETVLKASTSSDLNSQTISDECKMLKEDGTVLQDASDVISDGSDADFIDIAEVSTQSLEDTYSTNLVSASELNISSASQEVDDSESKDLPDDVAAIHTLPDDNEDIMQESTEMHHHADRPNEFEGLSQENIKDVQLELEAEQETLQQKRGQQERLATSITDQMYLEAQELLRLFGLPFITSPMEAEAQCAHLDVTKQTDGTITEDSDIWLFGAQKVYKNFFNQNKQVECYSFTEIKASIGLLRDQMIKIALLCGSDYTPGIQGVGPITALEIMAEFPGENIEGLINLKKWWDSTKTQHKVPQEIKLKSKLRQLEINDSFPNAAIVDAYLNPTVDLSDEPFTWVMPELDELRMFTANKMGWLRSKTDEVLLPVLAQMNKPPQPQMKITDFFSSSAPRQELSPEKCKSKRAKRAIQRCLQQVAVCPELPTSLNEERMKRAKDVVKEMRKTGAMPKCPTTVTLGQRRGRPSTRGQRRGAKVARTIQVKEELSLSESSSSDGD